MLDIGIVTDSIYKAEMFLREQDERFFRYAPNSYHDIHGNKYRLISVPDNMRGCRLDQIIVVGFNLDYQLLDHVKMLTYATEVDEKYVIQYVG